MDDVFEYDLALEISDGRVVEGVFYCNKDLGEDLENIDFEFTNSEESVYKLDIVPMPKIKKIVVYNDKATVIFWKDGTQTKVVLGDSDYPDLEKAVAMAIAKKYYGSFTWMERSLSRVKYVNNK